MSLPPVLGAPLRRDNQFEHSYFDLKNISTGISAMLVSGRRDFDPRPKTSGVASTMRAEQGRHNGEASA
jgi:hypothetical protein